MPLSGIKLERFSALMNGVFMGVGVIFLIWGTTDIVFPITERMNAVIFGLTRIILGVVSIGVGAGVEAIQWAKVEKEHSSDSSVDQSEVEVTQTDSE